MLRISGLPQVEGDVLRQFEVLAQGSKILSMKVTIQTGSLGWLQVSYLVLLWPNLTGSGPMPSAHLQELQHHTSEAQSCHPCN